MKRNKLTIVMMVFLGLFMQLDLAAQITTGPLGTSTSSSANRGPFQRSDTTSSSVFSRANLVYLESELVSTLGIPSGATIEEIQWDLGSSNMLTASGDATLNVYMKNSVAAGATAGQWSDIISAHTLVGTYTFNTSNNFPGSEGFLSFDLDNSFVYTGGTLEVAVEWDASGLSSVHSNPNRLFSGNGSLNWHWTATMTHTSLGVRAGSSSPPSEIRAQDLRAERVNTQFVYTPPATCMIPTNVSSSVVSNTSLDASWNAVIGANSYNWVLVAAGAGSAGIPIASGTTTNTMESITNISTDCGATLDFHVQADCGGGDISDFTAAHTIILETTTSMPLGTVQSASANRGPFQRSDSTSSSVFSRANMYFTQTEVVTTLGITAGSTISQVNWDLGSTNVITATGDAVMRVYMANTTNAGAIPGQWSTITANHILVGTYVFNQANNFPGFEGFLGFPLDVPFEYDGQTLEVAVEWDVSGLTSINSNSNRLFSGNGSLNWHWTGTNHASLAVRAGSSSFPSEFRPNNNNDIRSERVNTQFVFTQPASCVAPSNVTTSNSTATSIDVAWEGLSCAESYNWVVVESGAGPMAAPIVSGTATSPMVSITGISTECAFAYDFHVNSDCGGGDISDYTNAAIFTLGSTTSVPLGTVQSGSANRGPFQRSDSTSSSVFSRANMYFTQTEVVATLGITVGSTISQVNWDLGSSNIIAATGDAVMRIYMANTTNAGAIPGQWNTITANHVLVGTYVFNQANNFPGFEGFLGFPLDVPFEYDGQTLEVAVEWDVSGLTSINSNSNRLFSGNGSLNWHWTGTNHASLAVRAGSSSFPSEFRPNNNNDIRSERVNTQFVFNDPLVCEAPTNVVVASIMDTSVDISWDAGTCSDSYDYVVVPTGAGPGGTAIAMGTSTSTVVNVTGLGSATTYDVHILSDCGFAESSYTIASTFTTTGDQVDCPDILEINDQDITSDVYQAGISITSNGVVRTSSDVTYYAGDNIMLNPDFEVEDGGLFEADIQDCTNSPGDGSGDMNTFGLDPNLEPWENFDLTDWAIDTPAPRASDPCRAVRGDEDEWDQFRASTSSPYFFTHTDGGMRFVSPVGGATTNSSCNAGFPRSELREMLRAGNTSVSTTGVNANNWALGYQPGNTNHGGRNGVLTATLRVNEVTTTGTGLHPGRTIIGQIHAEQDEPARLYYRKLPNAQYGCIYLEHEIRNGNCVTFNLIGDEQCSGNGPTNGIELDELFSYEIINQGADVIVKVRRGDFDGAIINEVTVNMNQQNSGYDISSEWMYFKAGAYTQNNTGDPEDSDVITFYRLANSHDAN